MAIETALVFDKEGDVLAWHLPEGRTSCYIPDTRSLWNCLWDNREHLGGVAHTHPWSGEAWPSETDRTTFQSIERALGQTPYWVICTVTDTKVFQSKTPGGELEEVDIPLAFTWEEELVIESFSALGGSH